MSLIALAMGVDPAFVVTHHSVRVFLVVLIALPAFAWLQRAGQARAVSVRSAEPERRWTAERSSTVMDKDRRSPHHRPP